MARMREHFTLIYAKPQVSADDGHQRELYEEEEGAIWTQLSIMPSEDPFPGRNIVGGEMFWAIQVVL
ncbi:hypothetical protein OIV83_006090 [Microbotryomycetes sp. JL201]|nr:hypothetical protein OIV83_006090 [Microbotryomycetes sp. JL201]